VLPRNNGFQSQHDIQLVEQARSLISELAGCGKSKLRRDAELSRHLS
jgi:hypothetical protein